MATPNIKLRCLNDSGTSIFTVNQTAGVSSTILLQAFAGISVPFTNNATSLTSSSLTVAGGASITKNILLGGFINDTLISTGSLGSQISSGSLQLSGNAVIGGDLIVAGSTFVMNETVSNSVNVNITASSIYISSGGLIATFNSNTIGNIYTTGGNVGINTTSPGYNLDVMGTTRLTNGLIPNLNSTNSTCLNVLATNVSTSMLQVTSSTISNIFSNNLTSNNINASFVTSGTILNTGLFSTLNLLSTQSTLANATLTNVTASNLSVTSSTVASLLSTNLSSSNLSATTSTLSNIFSSNITSGQLYVSSITSNNILATGIVSSASLFATTSTLPNVFTTNITSSSLVSSTATFNNVNTSNIVASNITATNALITSSSVSSLLVSASSTLNAVSTNSTSSNSVVTNLTGSNIFISIGTIGSLYSSISTNLNSVSTNLTATNLITTTATIPSMTSINITTSSLVASSGITAGNINFTGSLYQNGSLYTSSQWIGTSGTSLYYGSTGSVFVGIGTTNPQYTLDVNGIARFTGGISTGTLAITNNLNMYSSVYHNTYGSYLTSSTSSGLIYSGTVSGPNLYGVGGGILGYNGNVAVVSWNSSGNVGINTTTQTYNLDVIGSTRVSGGMYLTTPFVVNNTSNSSSVTGAGLNISGDVLLSGGTVGNIYWTNTLVNGAVSFSNRSPGSRIIVYPNISNNTLDYSIGVESQNLWFSSPGGFKWYANSTSATLTLTSGNVGINTSVPSSSLDVTGTARFTTSVTTNSLYSTNITSTNSVFTSSTVSSLTSAQISSGTLSVTNQIVNNSLVSNQTVSSLNATNSTFASVLITNSLSASFDANTIGSVFTTGGNVGINTTTPGYKLDISGTTRINNTTFSTNNTTGALYCSGGIAVNGTNASSSTSGGALTVAGGLAVSQDAYFGSNLFIRGVNSSVVTGLATIGTVSTTGTYQKTVNIGRTMSDTNYKIVGNISTITSNTNVYSVSFTGITTTSFTANIYRLDALGASLGIDPNLNLSWLIYP